MDLVATEELGRLRLEDAVEDGAVEDHDGAPPRVRGGVDV